MSNATKDRTVYLLAVLVAVMFKNITAARLAALRTIAANPAKTYPRKTRTAPTVTTTETAMTIALTKTMIATKTATRTIRRMTVPQTTTEMMDRMMASKTMGATTALKTTIERTGDTGPSEKASIIC